MSEPEGAPPKRDDETSPFPLERGRIESETTGERTGPFLLEREKPISDAPPPPEPASSEEPVPDARAPVVALTQSARRARRRIAVTLLVHATMLAVLCTISIVRWTKGIATPPELALAVLSGGVALVHLRAGLRFARLGQKSARDGHLLVGAFGDLRTVIVLKAVSLFLALTLLCFSLSMVISLVASF